jgi:MFS family permease
MLALQVAVQISGPYFTSFMLGQLKMSYASYLLLIATSFTARIVMLPMLGRLTCTIGAQRVLWYSGVGIVPLSALWIFGDSILYLLIVQFVAGAVWAAYELATFLLLFETIREEERTSVLTTFNFANAVAMVAGALLGGALLGGLGTDHTAYMVIFGISGVVRLGTLPLLARSVGKPLTMQMEPMPVPTGVLAVRPNLGAIERPLLPGIDGESEPAAELAVAADQATSN